VIKFTVNGTEYEFEEVVHFLGRLQEAQYGLDKNLEDDNEISDVSIDGFKLQFKTLSQLENFARGYDFAEKKFRERIEKREKEFWKGIFDK